MEKPKPTNGDLLQIQEGLERLQINLPLPLSYKLAKIRIQVDDALRPYIVERKRIIERYAKKDKNKNIVFSEGNIEFDDVSAAQAELDKLLEVEVDVKLDRVSVKEFPQRKDISSKGLTQIGRILDA